MSKLGLHHYGADGHIGKLNEWYDTRIGIPQVLRINLFITLNSVLQTSSTRVDPNFFDVWWHAHRGTDLEHPEQLCDDVST
jgi:hypothetical protein